MKKYLLCLCAIAFLCFSVFAQEQKVKEERFQLPRSKEVSLNLKFASKIIIKPSDNQELLLKTTFTYDDEQFLKVYEQEVNEKDNTLSISTDYDLSEFQERKYNCWSCEEETYNDQECFCFKTSYELYIPKDALVELETISGDIEILDFPGSLKVKSISGFLDCSLSQGAKTNLSFKSVTGEIYTDFDIKLDKDSSAYSKKVNTSINGGGSKISLETVSGDIYFRKI